MVKLSEAENEKQPLLLLLSAHALSSIGFGLSIIAISLQWLCPISHEPQGPLNTNNRLLFRSDQNDGPSRSLSPDSMESGSKRHARHVNLASAVAGQPEVRETVTPPPVRQAESDSSLPRAETSSSSLSTTIVPVDDVTIQSTPHAQLTHQDHADEAQPAKKSGKFIKRACHNRKLKSSESVRDTRTPSPTRPRSWGPANLKEETHITPSERPRSPFTRLFECRRSAPASRVRTMPYEAPYFAMPPGMTGESRKSHRKSESGGMIK